MSFYPAAMIGIALLTIVQVDEEQCSNASGHGLRSRIRTPIRNGSRYSRKGLAELGNIEGKNIHIEYREAVLDAEYDGVMADLVARKVDIIVAANVAATQHGQSDRNYPDRHVGSFRSSWNRCGHEFRAAGHERHRHDRVRSPIDRRASAGTPTPGTPA